MNTTATHNHPIIVAIDGYSSSGKSTMAKRLARAVGYRYIDTGSMYRAVTLAAMRRGIIDAEGNIDLNALHSLLPDVAIDWKVLDDGQHTLLNGEDVEGAIRSIEVSNLVSYISAVAEVRHALTAMQQRLGQGRGIVMDGRDIGTTVFPDAELKIFVDASAETRARRRWAELEAKGMPATYEEVLRNVTERDHIDRTRKESPLRCAADAVKLDNSLLSLDDQDAVVLDLFNKAVNK